MHDSETAYGRTYRVPYPRSRETYRQIVYKNIRQVVATGGMVALIDSVSYLTELLVTDYGRTVQDTDVLTQEVIAYLDEYYPYLPQRTKPKLRLRA
jgi:hypothetical protein